MVETNYLVVGRLIEKSLTTILVPLKSILLGEFKMFFAQKMFVRYLGFKLIYIYIIIIKYNFYNGN